MRSCINYSYNYGDVPMCIWCIICNDSCNYTVCRQVTHHRPALWITTSSLAGQTTESQSTPPPWSACFIMSGKPGSWMYPLLCTAGASQPLYILHLTLLLYFTICVTCKCKLPHCKALMWTCSLCSYVEATDWPTVCYIKIHGIVCVCATDN